MAMTSEIQNEKGPQVIVAVEEQSVKSVGLEKGFGILSTSALQFSLICSSLAIGTFLSTVIGVGGSPVLIYGYILAGIFDLIVCYSLAELQSAYPHSSAQVHWTYVLAPPRIKKLMSYIVGILSCAGWIFACFSSTYVATSFIYSMVALYHPDFAPTNYQFYLVYCAIAVSGFLVNAFLVLLLPIITNSLVVIMNVGTLFILITLLVKTNPKQSVDFVFKNIINETGWNSNGVVFFLGLLPSIASVTLYDGACHMTDEVDEPERKIPLVMIISNTSSCILGLISAIIYMFCVVSLDSLSDPIAGQPIVQLMVDSFESSALSTVGILVLILSFVGSTYMYYTSTSRLFWSFAVSNGLPFGNFFGKVNHTLKVPFNALCLVMVLILILGTIMFGSTSALSAVLGSAMVCVNLSYVFPIIFHLIKSNFSSDPRKRFREGGYNSSIDPILNEKTKLPYFNLGRFGIFLNFASIFWACFIMVWLNFPLVHPVSSDSMNYACVVLGITGVVGVLFWVVTARKLYNHDIDLKHS